MPSRLYPQFQRGTLVDGWRVTFYCQKLSSLGVSNVPVLTALTQKLASTVGGGIQNDGTLSYYDSNGVLQNDACLSLSFHFNYDDALNETIIQAQIAAEVLGVEWLFIDIVKARFLVARPNYEVGLPDDEGVS